MKLNAQQLETARFLTNSSSGTYRAFGEVFPRRNLNALLSTSALLSTKHDFNLDFGYKDDVDFYDLYEVYKRGGVAKSLVKKTVGKTWETMPELREDDDTDRKDTAVEKEVARWMGKMRFWQMLMETDKRSLVGEYSALIFQYADGKSMDQPVDGKVSGGLGGLIGVLPAWEGQFHISEWDQDRNSPTWGQPIRATYTESSVDAEEGKYRSFQVHRDRFYIWSKDRTTFNDSDMEAVYNALVDMEKIRGATAEGFWKNSKAQPVLEAAGGADAPDFAQLAQMLGTTIDGLPEALDNVVADWSRGHDQSLMLQGMKAYNLSVSQIQPKESYDIAAGEAAAGFDIPMRILFGNQTGERASTEDAAQWNRTNMSRRRNYTSPNVMDVVDILKDRGILHDIDWHLEWEDLTGATEEQRLERIKGMSQVNRDSAATGDVVFADDEIRSEMGFGPRDVDPGFSETDDDEPPVIGDE